MEKTIKCKNLMSPRHLHHPLFQRKYTKFHALYPVQCYVALRQRGYHLHVVCEAASSGVAYWKHSRVHTEIPRPNLHIAERRHLLREKIVKDILKDDELPRKKDRLGGTKRRIGWRSDTAYRPTPELVFDAIADDIVDVILTDSFFRLR